MNDCATSSESMMSDKTAECIELIKVERENDDSKVSYQEKDESDKDDKTAENSTTEIIEDNPYAYLDRDFSSEKYKIVVRGLSKFCGIGVRFAFLSNSFKF